MAHLLLSRKQEPTSSDSSIMDAFSPEFAQHWFAGQELPTDECGGRRGDDLLSPAQQEALEELAERVNAARSVY